MEINHFEGRFLTFKTIETVNSKGKKVVWEYIGRRTTQGIDTIARSKDNILINVEKRYPVDSFVLGFPGGICDDDNNIIAQAVKELKEETGYSPVNTEELKLQPLVFIDPWKSTEKTQYVDVEIDENSTGVEQSLEEMEVITTKFVNIDNLSNELKSIADENGFKFDARLYSYAFGREIGKRKFKSSNQ